MAPPVLCLLFVSLLHLSSIHPAVSSAGLQVRGHQVGRKLFDESTSSSSSSSDSSSSSSSSSDSGSSSTPSDSGSSSSSSSSSDSGASESSSSSSDTVQVNDPTEFTPVPENPAPSPKSPSPAPKSTAPSMKTANTTINAPSKAALSPPPTPWFLGGSSLSDSSFAGYSYAFPSDILNFTDAEVYCRKNYKNGHLVSIHSQAQQDFLNQKYVQGTAVNFLSVLVPQQYPPKDGVGHRGVWIGLQTTGKNQGWTDGTPYDYDSFLAGKPDNWQGIEGCVQIYGDTTPVGWSGFWDDISCESKMRFICSWPILDSKDTAYPVYNGSMYIYHSEIATWETAESTCWKLDNGHLVSIHSKQQADWIWQTFVFPKKTVDFSVQLPIVYQQDPNAMVTSHRGIWIGLNLQRSTPYWTDFSPYDYKDWAPSQPDNWNNIEFCTSLYVDAAPKGYQTKWDDLACEAQLPFLCTRPVNQSDEVYPQYKGWEYIMMNEAMTWMAANRSCVDKYDAQVVSFDSQEELSFVYSQYFQVASNNYPVLLPSIYTDPSNLAAVNQSYRGIGRRGVWIGLINRDSGVWQWSDGSSSTFKAWVPGKPDNFLSAESCTQLYIDSKPTGWASYWDDLACTALCSAICKRRPRKTAVQAPSGVENPYAQEILPYMNTTPIAADAVISDATLPNATFMSKKTSSMSKRSVIALAVVGGFIGLLVLSSIVWHFLRPSNNEEEVVAAGAAAAGAGVAALPNNYKGKAKATGVVHAPTGTGRLPPAKVAATREARPSKYVKINVEDLEVPPENFTFPPSTVPMEQQHEVMHKH